MRQNTKPKQRFGQFFRPNTMWAGPLFHNRGLAMNSAAAFPELQKPQDSKTALAENVLWVKHKDNFSFAQYIVPHP